MKLLSLFLLIFLTSFYCNAQLSSYMNYTDPKDGKSLHGWTGPLESLKSSLDPGKNYALAILHKPVNAFLMQDIFLFRSTVAPFRNELVNSSLPVLGHMQVGWACHIPGRSGRFYGITGQSGEFQNQGKEMLLEGGFGMSLFFANFTDGVLQSADVSARRIQRTPSSKFTWIAFEISQKDCSNGLAYLNNYIKKKAYRNFSFTKNPKNYSGGGCTSFASTALQKFGAFRETLVDAWQTKLKIPRSFVGNPLDSYLPNRTELPAWLDQDFYENNFVDVVTMAILPFPGAFTGSLEAKIFDTELIQFSLNSMIKRARNANPQTFGNISIGQNRRAYGLANKGVGGAPMSSQKSAYITVDQNYHPQFKSVYNYINHPRLPAPDFKVSYVGRTPGLIFERAVW